MRHHFHRCGHLRVIEIDVSDMSQVRKGGSQIVEELCEARHLARCVGLAECDVLAPAQKRDLLAARATRLREEEAGHPSFADLPDPRGAALRALRDEFASEHRRIVDGNRARKIDAAAAVQRNPRPLPPGQERELAGAGISFFEDESLRELRTARLDALERALDAIARGRYGDCARCGKPIAAERLRAAPDTAVCEPCAEEVWPDTSRPAWAKP